MRKETTIILDDRGRELTFKIKEMPALKLESWIIRAGLLLAGTGLLELRTADAPDAGELARNAGQIMAEKGLSALGAIDYERARPLLDELLFCCSHVVDGVARPLTPETVEGIIEDVKTLFALRKEALSLNFGFFGPGVPSASEDAGTTPPQALPNPKISARSRR